MGTRLSFISAYHFQTDGQTERVNQVLEDMLRACVLSYGKNWEKCLPFAEFSYNISLGMICCAERKTGPHSFLQAMPKTRREYRPTIGNDRLRYTMQTHDAGEVEVGQHPHTESGTHRQEMRHFCQPINDDPNGILLLLTCGATGTCSLPLLH